MVSTIPNAASRLSGSQNATASFALATGNAAPKDLVFGIQSGTNFLWVVNDDTVDRVFRYSLNQSGTASGSLFWPIDASNPEPTGITLDPSNGSMDIWISDISTDRVYRYANGRTLTNPRLTSSFPLAPGNGDVQGIADPPPVAVEHTLAGYRVENVAPAGDSEAPVINRVNSPTLNRLESNSGTSTNGSLISSSQGKGSDLRTNNRRRTVAPVAAAVPRSSSPLQATRKADVDVATTLSANPMQLDVLFSDLQNVGWN